MIRTIPSRHIFLATLLAVLGLISLAAPAHAQTASCNVLTSSAGPAWSSGAYNVGGASYSRDEGTGYGSGSYGSDGAAQGACQSTSQSVGSSGVCQDQLSYQQSGYYLDGSSPNYYLCQYEICANVQDTSTWTYYFFPGPTSITYSPPSSYNGDTFDGQWHYVNNGSNYASAGVCGYTPPAAPPPTASIYASPSSITQGGGSTLYWSSSNASYCTGTNFSTGGATSGAAAVYPSTSTSYYVTCYGPGGGASAGTTVSVTVPVYLPDVLTTPSLPNFSATVGQTVTLTAPVTNQGAGGTGRAFLGEFIISNYAGAWYPDVNGTNVSVPAIAAYGGATSVSMTRSFPTAGTWYYQFCPNYYNMNSWLTDITESNYANNCDQTAGIVTVSPAAPDLVPGTPPNLTLTAGQSNLFTSMVTNNGGSATSGGFWNVLRICDAGCTTYNDHSQEGWMNTLGAGASNGIGANGTAPLTPGQYYYQIVPNNNTAFQNIVAESNYSNNAGQWASLTVTAPPTPTCSLSASPSTISTGQSTTLSWSSTNAASCTGSGFSTGGAKTGSLSVTPGSLPTSYGLSCSGAGGTSCNATPVTLSNSCAVGTLSESITASPSRLGTAGNSTITYSATNVQGASCTVTGTDGYSMTYPANSCGLATTGTVHAITKQTTYTITCDGVSKSVIVNLDPNFQEF